MEYDNQEKNLLYDADCTTSKDTTLTTSPTNETELNPSSNVCVGGSSSVSDKLARKKSKKYEQARDLQNLGTRIDTGILHAFKTFVLGKYGRLNRVFSLEIESALEHYLNCPNKQRHTTSSTFLENSRGFRSDVQTNLELIAKKFLVTSSYPEFSAETIKKTIKDIIGKDRDGRTFSKYLDIIRKSAKEKPSGFSLYPIFDVTKFCEQTLGMSLDTVDKNLEEENDEA